MQRARIRALMMINFLFFLLSVTILPWASAADVVFHNANQFTLEWNAVTADADGDPLTDVTYEVLLANAITDSNKTNPTVMPFSTTTATITLGVKGRYFVGVRSVWDDLRSEINWGDLPDGQTAPVFGVRFAVPPVIPNGFNKK